MTNTMTIRLDSGLQSIPHLMRNRNDEHPNHPSLNRNNEHPDHPSFQRNDEHPNHPSFQRKLESSTFLEKSVTPIY
jgi:hypothetical protein